MDDDYYGVVRDNKRVREGLPLLSPEGLILLKAKAFLDLNSRRQQGDHVDEKHIKKHRNDVFKLSLLLALDQQITIPPRFIQTCENSWASFTKTIRSGGVSAKRSD